MSVYMNYVSWFSVLYLISAYLRIYPLKKDGNVTFWGWMTALSWGVSIFSIFSIQYLQTRLLGHTNVRHSYFFVSDSNSVLALTNGITSFMWFKNLKIKILARLVQNWCLVHYCRLYPKFVTTCRNHWASELRAIVVEISSYKLCKDNERRDKKREATRKIIIDYFEHNDIETVELVIHAKFYDANIRNYEDGKFIASQFIKELDVIIDMITNGSTDDIDAYIEKL